MWGRFKTFDVMLFGLPILLMLVSVVMIYSLTSQSIGSSLYMRQAIYSVVGLVSMVGLSFIDYRILKNSVWYLYAAGVLGLIIVRLFGHSDFGAQRWINLGFFKLQPSELMKLILIITLAYLLGRPMARVSWKQFAAIVALIMVPFALIMSQPDLGTSLIVFFTSVGMLLYARLSKAQKRVVLGGVACLGLVTVLAFQNVQPFGGFLKPYQKDRLTSFLHPEADGSRTGYNVLQSTIAVGSGGLTGKGLGQGSQSQLNFLPVAHADFIFAGIAETWGYIGSLSIIVTLCYLVVRLLQASKVSPGEFEMLLCAGCAIKILVESFINIGMNIGIMPVTGIPLPFLSSGGTTLLTNAIMIGIVQSIVVRHKRLTFSS